MIEAVVFLPANLGVPACSGVQDSTVGGPHGAAVQSLHRAVARKPALHICALAAGDYPLTQDGVDRTPLSPGWWAAEVLVEHNGVPTVLEAVPGITPGRHVREGCPKPLQGARWAIGAAARETPPTAAHMVATWRSLEWRNDAEDLGRVISHRGPTLLIACLPGAPRGGSARQTGTGTSLTRVLARAVPGEVADVATSIWSAEVHAPELQRWLGLLTLVQDSQWVGDVVWSGAIAHAKSCVAVWSRQVPRPTSDGPDGDVRSTPAGVHSYTGAIESR